MVRPMTRDGALGLSVALTVTVGFWLAAGMAIALAFGII